VVSKLLESLSATFLLTASAYAAGVVQSKELYRELGVEPEVVSIDFQKALYDGGLLVFSELSKDLLLLIPYFLGVILISGACLLVRPLRTRMVSNKKSLLNVMHGMSIIALLWVLYDTTVASFASGRQLGGEFASHLKSVCTQTSVYYEGGVKKELCSVGRTTDLIWFYDPKAEKAIAFGKDKIIKLESG
jgi:hypothetical protein